MTHRYPQHMMDVAVEHHKRGSRACDVGEVLHVSANVVHQLWYHARNLGLIEAHRKVDDRNPIEIPESGPRDLTAARMGDPLPGRSALDGFVPPGRYGYSKPDSLRRRPWDPRAGRMEAAE